MDSDQSSDNFFSQNLISIFAACYSSAGMNENDSVINQCVNAGAQSAMGFSEPVYDQENLYFCCKVLYKILNGKSINNSYTQEEGLSMFENGFGEVNVIGNQNKGWFKGLYCFAPHQSLDGVVVDFSNINSILQYAQLIKNKKS